MLSSVFKRYPDWLLVLLPELLWDVALVQFFHKLFALFSVIILKLSTFHCEPILIKNYPDLSVRLVSLRGLRVRLCLLNDVVDIVWVLYR